MSETTHDKIMNEVQKINHKGTKFYQVGTVDNDAPLWRTAVYDVNAKDWNDKKELFRGNMHEVLRFIKTL